MIIAKAKHWVNYNGTWYRKDDVFPIEDGDSPSMSKHAVLVETEDDKKQNEAQTLEPAKRGRKRKV